VREIETQEKRNSEQFAAMCQALLDRGLKVRFRAQGESMRPNILQDDAVVVAPAAPGELEHGDVLLTRAQDALRLHRCVGQNFAKGEVITRGDSGQENDAATSHVLGKVVAVHRNAQEFSMTGSTVRFLHSSRAQFHRLKLAAARRFKQFSAVTPFFGILVVFGTLLNAAPAAAQADLTMTQNASVSVVDTGINFTYTEIATNNGPNAVPAGTLVID
jgi:hypothetical protein